MFRPRHRRRRSRFDEHRWPRRLLAPGAGLALAAVAFVLVQLLRPVPGPSLRPVVPALDRLPGALPSLATPAGAQAIVAVQGLGVLAAAGTMRPSPIASVTKVMAALVVLRDHPLRPGEQGPRLTVTASDVTTYEREQAAGDSVVAVRAGERLSELQALEAALVPSGDNIVRLLARWDAGDTGRFVAKMNALARALGLRHTHYAGPSGVDPRSVSTAADQVRLAQVALANPVFARIVSLPQVNLPVAGLQYNVDGDLGRDGIVGVKTGWVPAGGASFVVAARRDSAGHAETIIGAVVGVTGGTPLPSALAAGRALVETAARALRRERVLPAGKRIATLVSPDGSRVAVVTDAPVSLVAWPGAAVVETVDARPRLALPARAGAPIGTLTVRLGSERARVGLVAGGPLAAPSLSWRFWRL
ncbi:MAG TPA: hypothetical protein VKV23_07995 [Acidimicrobiales bacterium]|nr:hypothetical protein [Acidimicrobiales bacterium]